MILIDSRVGSAEFAQILPPDECQLTTLEYGDFAWTGNGPEGVPWNVGIERKAISDFVNSMCTGRFSGHQLPGLLNTYNDIYVIVEGLLKFDSREKAVQTRWGAGWGPLTIGGREITCNEIIGFLTTIDMMAGVHLVRTNGKYETAQYLLSLSHWWCDKEWEDHRAHMQRHRGVVSLTQLSLVRRIAAELPGIGLERSKIVAQIFPTVERMVSASVDDWSQLEGIGKKTALKVFQALHNE